MNTFRINEILNAFDNNLVGNISENLITSFRSLLEAVVSSISGANLKNATRPMIEVLQTFMDLIGRLRSANVVVPPALFELIAKVVETLINLRRERR